MDRSSLPSSTFFIASFLTSRAILLTPALSGVRGVWEPTEPQGVGLAADCSVAASMCYSHDSSYPSSPGYSLQDSARQSFGRASRTSASWSRRWPRTASPRATSSKSAMTMHPSSESTLAVSRRPIARLAVHELGHTRIGALQNASSETALPIGSLRKLLGFGHDHRHTHASLDEYHAYFAAAGAASYASNGRAH